MRNSNKSLRVFERWVMLSGKYADVIRSRPNHVSVRFSVARRRLAFYLEKTTWTHDSGEEDEDLKTTKRLADTASRSKAERIERLDQSTVDDQRTTSACAIDGFSNSGGRRIRLVVVVICNERTCSVRKVFCGLGASVSVMQEPLGAEDVGIAVPDVWIATDRPQVSDDDTAGRDRQLAGVTGRRRIGDVDVDVGEVRKGERHDRRQSHRFQHDGLDVRQSPPVVVRHRLTRHQLAIQLRVYPPLWQTPVITLITIKEQQTSPCSLYAARCCCQSCAAFLVHMSWFWHNFNKK